MYNLKRQPTHPGVILKEDFIAALGLTQADAAKRLKTTVTTINDIINGKRNISPDMALRLARFFGTSDELWLNLQDQYDLYNARLKNKDVLNEITPYHEIAKE
ncbi:Addiction module antidote protein, HigA [Candidatus Magnetoovum chiemensis]|nr:Addiction module antidote protein, HigA [Candidatus Magnetoovum chiemensis]